jgi:GT2 family glycosyltransferase
LKLSIIIVNYKSSNYIKDCLRSAIAFDSYKNFEWIVVDNDSKDQSKEILTKEFPFLLWHDMGYNAGFARANNAGIQMAKGSVVLLLNPDTLILNDAIQKTLEVFTTSAYVACGVQMLNPDFTPQISGNHFMKGGLNHLLPLPYWGSFLKWVAGLFKVEKPSIDVAGAEEKADWISGAFLMVKKQIIDKAGLLDNDFFLYAEEVEWCSRLKQHGALCIYGNIHIVHIIGEVISANAGSKDKSYTNLYDQKGLQYIVSNHLRIRKQYGLFWFFIQLLNYTIGVPIYFLASILENIFTLKNPWPDIKKSLALGYNVLRVWALSWRIIRQQPYFYKVL